MAAIAGLFDRTILCLPCARDGAPDGTSPLEGRLEVVPLPAPWGSGWMRKLLFPLWTLRCLPTIARVLFSTDAVHAPIPGDVGTLGMFAALVLRKPLFVRHCGNWDRTRTTAERLWRWSMERLAGGRNVMAATGGREGAPSANHPAVQWIFSTSLSEEQLRARGRARQAPVAGKLRLIHAGRQEEDKGARLVIEALPILRGTWPGVRLDVVGAGGALGEFRALAERLGVSDHVTFHGRLPHERVLERLLEADVFCFPTSASEGFPKAVLEALASGLPVVTTPVSVLPALIGDGAGVIVKERTAAAVAAGVLACVEAERYEAMSRRAIDVASRYSLEAWASEIGRRCERAWGRPLRSEPVFHALRMEAA